MTTSDEPVYVDSISGKTRAQLYQEAGLTPQGQGSKPQLADDESPCIECGVRPWGHGYCGELCTVCASRPDPTP